MLTKYLIEIDGQKVEIPKECIKNWDEIQCVYKRTDFSGVTRSFTSQFEFVGEMYDKLVALYLRDGFASSAILFLFIITDRWEWVEQFSCPLDFSTIKWDSHVLQINCVDNSVAALIKANKSTKYEFEIGSDIVSKHTFNFDRIPMSESVTYGFTNGDTYANSADILVHQMQNTRMWMGCTGQEITINQTIAWNDDQEDNEDGYLFSVEKDVEVTLDLEYSYRSDEGNKDVMQFLLGVNRNGQPVTGSYDWYLGCITKDKVLTNYISPSSLPPAGHDYDSTYAIISGTVWLCQYCGHIMPNGTPYEWRNLNKPPEEVFLRRTKKRLKLNLLRGDKVFINANNYGGAACEVTFRCTSSRFTFSWLARGENIDISVFRPETVVNAILRRMAGSKMNLTASISNYDKRLSNTFLMAAESVRGIPNAKFYSSFNDFCDWISTVFGYTYYLGSPLRSRYEKIVPVGDTFYSPWSYKEESWQGPVDVTCITFIGGHGQFFYVPKTEQKLYTVWAGSNDYRGPDGYPRTDRLYEIDGELFYFDEYREGRLPLPIQYEFEADGINNQSQSVNFVHRSELFNGNAGVRRIANIRECSYSVDSGQIFSSIVIGYDKKDYESINGRDEFNFNNSYSTGCSVSGKKLSMMSRYRADCYGLEFTAQKRGIDTTDNQSDNSVFFVLCLDAGGVLVPDRSIPIENALSDAVFNGAFSPLSCIDANAGYIGMQAESLDLEFASSEGNNSIVIDGRPMAANINLNTPLMTCGLLEFVTDSSDFSSECSEMVEVENAGFLYRGFVSEVSYVFARNEAVKYKIIVKDVKPC